MIVVDSSAVVALALREPEQHQLRSALHAADRALISPVNFVESGMVLRGRDFITDREDLELFLSEHGIAVENELALQGPALDAFLRYGKGRHPARLNLADCFAYALAKALDAPLLYKGDDFAQTDIRSAL